MRIYDSGVCGIAFEGGEPLLRADLAEILAFSKDFALVEVAAVTGYSNAHESTILNELVGRGITTKEKQGRKQLFTLREKQGRAANHGLLTMKRG